MFGLLRKGLQALFPAHTVGGQVLRIVMARLGNTRDRLVANPFVTYTKRVEPIAFHAPIQTPSTCDQPLFSVIIPFFNTADAYLVPLLDCLSSQSFSDWEVIMADASTNEDRSWRIEELSHRDPRFRYVRLGENRGISTNTNEALGHALGQYIVFADHDDTLSHHALNEVAVAIADHPGVDVLYSDEDALSDDGLRRKRPHFKPSWSPHMFLEMNYTNHLSVIKAALIHEVGGLRPERDGAQDYDLLLRIHALPRQIQVVHIPKILYHWREAENSTSRTIDTKTYAVQAGQAALTDYLDAIGVSHDPVGVLPERPFWYHCRPRWSCRADVVVMVSEDDRANRHFEKLLRGATAATWVVPSFIALSPACDIRAHCDSGTADVVIVVRSMFLPETPDWLDELAGVLALPKTAAVAPLLMRNMRHEIVNAGLMDDQGRLRPLYPGGDVTVYPLAGPPDLVRDVDGLDPGVVAFPRASGHSELFLPGVVDGRNWSDYLVMWGPVRFRPAKIPARDKRLNDNLMPRGASVVFRNSMGTR
ncbi:MAG: glycosyltransferase [Propionibacteriaceae bacterium]|nr:glycosyltransferase [Propionibacteriaceae bacterium]